MKRKELEYGEHEKKKSRPTKQNNHTDVNWLDLPCEIWEMKIFSHIPWMKPILEITCKDFNQISDRVPDPEFKWSYLEEDNQPSINFMKYLIENDCR